MGIYLNPDRRAFAQAVHKNIYIDKSLLIEKVWTNATGKNQYICVSRPRRFGKSTDANMLAAYYSKGSNAHDLFDSLQISGC